jgi:hypothetical protein
LHELTPQLASLEEAFLELTSDSLEFGHMESEPDGDRPGAERRQPESAQTTDGSI